MGKFVFELIRPFKLLQSRCCMKEREPKFALMEENTGNFVFQLIRPFKLLQSRCCMKEREPKFA